jgi:multiple sugar transport system permease protein
MKRSLAHQLLVYVLLIAGALAFAFPFVWMASSSMKVDREMFSEDLKILPMAPRPMGKSPFVDDAYYTSLAPTGPGPEVLPELEKLVDASGFEFPANVDAEVARAQVARGVYSRLSKRLPGDTWNSTVAEVATAAKPIVDKEMVRQVFKTVYRFAAIGSIHLRDQGIDLVEVGGDETPSGRWTIKTGQAQLVDFNDEGKPAARLEYEFGSSPDVQLVGDFDSSFDLAQLKSVRIDFHPDDTWHDLRVTVEHGGRKYVAHRANSLANFDWQTFTWQHASASDNSTELRTWIVLDEAGTSDVTGPNKLRITLDLHRVTQATAWANKAKLNYIRVNEQIPFWRYVRVSVFLVLANIILVAFGSSLAAYAFSRIVFPGRDFLFIVMLATMMIPAQVTMIPSFLVWKTAGAYNTLAPLWIGAAFGNAFFIFMLRQFMNGIPRDLEDAARIDGCGFLRIYWHVIVPLIKPSLAAIAVMSFIGTWNDFMGPLIYIADQRLYPLAFGLYAFSVQVNNNPALSMAGSVMMTVPIIAIFFAAQRYFIQGVTLTGMKG